MCCNQVILIEESARGSSSLEVIVQLATGFLFFRLNMIVQIYLLRATAKPLQSRMEVKI